MSSKANSCSDKLYSCGEVISRELPFVHVLDSSHKSSKCDFCLRSHSSLKRCSKCLKQYYCERQCQRSDWKWHRNECQLIANNYNRLFDDFLFRLVLRLWLSIKRSNDLLFEKKRVFNGFERCLNDFESHESDISCDENRMKQFNEFCEVFTELRIDFDRKLLLRLYGQLLINTFSIVVHDLTYNNEKSGYGVYVCSSVFDHSCRPNAAVIFDDIQIEIRAIKDIAKDEEIFIHYIALDINREERRIKLKNQYYFECNCAKCVEEVDHSIDYDRFRALVSQLHHCISGENDEKEVPSLEELLSLSEQIYGQIHPEMAAILMVVMQFQLLSPDLNYSAEEMSRFIERVGRTIQLSFGSNHKFYRMFKTFVNIKNMVNFSKK